MITENDKFEISDRYKQMTLEEIRKEKDTLFKMIKEGDNSKSGRLS